MTPSIVFKSHHEVAEYKGSNHDLDYIDHELSVNLDSTDAFEGPEKLLELWFSPTDCDLPPAWPKDGLRAIPLTEIEQLLQIVNCEILSKVSSPQMDAYLLSESSLFVYPNKFILKTCGTTTTLLCFDKLRELIHKYCHDPRFEFRSIYRVFYSHRSFLFPDRQKGVHRSWEAELECLNSWFDESTSNAYILGDGDTAGSTKARRDETWHLYVNGTNEFNGCTGHRSSDITIELLMTELDPHSSAQFELSHSGDKATVSNPETEDVGHVVGEYLMHKCGLDRIVVPASADEQGPAGTTSPELKHDAFAFTPCGFSSNSIIDGDKYYTIHITPEKGWSYASFETNFTPSSSTASLPAVVDRVLQVVRPGRFALIVCYEHGHGAQGLSADALAGLQSQFRLEKHVSADIEHGYNLLYALYSRR